MSSRFSEITPNDHAGVIWIISLLCLVYTTLTFITRGFIKWNLLGWDDWAITVSQVFAYAQYIALFISLKRGLGRTSEMLTTSAQAQVSQAAFTSQLLLILALCLSKCSVILLIRRVFTRDLAHFWLICNVLVGFCAVWAVAAPIMIGAGCNIDAYVPPPAVGQCSGLAARWTVVVALDVITEIIMIVMPVYFLWSLQMTVNLKARVVLAFAFRLPVAAFALVFLRQFTTVHKSSNPGVSVSSPIYWHQLQLAYSLISATIPSLKSFLKAFDTNFGMGDGSSQHPYYGSGGSQPQNSYHSHSQSRSHARSAYSTSVAGHESHTPPMTIEAIQMNTMKPRRSNGDLKKGPEFEGPLRPERLKNSTTIVAGDEGRPDSRGSVSSQAGSQEMIIRRDVHFEIQHNYLRPESRVGVAIAR